MASKQKTWWKPTGRLISIDTGYLNALEQRVATLRAALAEHCYTSWFDSRYCKECHRLEELGHLSWCKVGELLDPAAALSAPDTGKQEAT